MLPTFDAGLFIILGGLGFVFMLISFRFGEIFKIFSAVLFFSLSVILVSGYDIIYIDEFVGGSDCPASNPCTTTKYMIDENGEILGWVFFAFGILVSFMMLAEVTGLGRNDD